MLSPGRLQLALILFDHAAVAAWRVVFRPKILELATVDCSPWPDKRAELANRASSLLVVLLVELVLRIHLGNHPVARVLLKRWRGGGK